MATIWLCPSAFHPHIGGIEEATRRIGLELQARDLTVRVVTHRHPAELPVRDDVLGIPVNRITFPAPYATLGGVASAAAAIRPMVRALASVGPRPDVMHVHGVSLQAPALAAYCMARRIPLVITTHGEVSADDHRVFDHSVYLRQGLRLAAIRAAELTAVSTSARDAAASIAPRFSAAELIGNGVDVNEWPTSEPVGDPVFAAWGRHEHAKGFDILIRAFGQVRLELPGARLLIGGDGTEHERLRSAAGDGVVFLGRLDRNEVGRLLARTRVVVVPSRLEAFGLVALEAMATGRTVVWSDLPGLRAATGGLGYSAPAENVTALVSAMVAAHRAPLESRQVRAHAAANAWGEVVNQYLRLYRRTASSITWGQA